MKVDVLDKTGKSAGSLDLEDTIFGVTPNVELMTQYVRVYQLNQRQGTSAAKTRSEVSGGGRKPWRQKGTGRARHGSIRSPIWRTGGVTHGPKPKSWNKKLPKRMRKMALLSALSLKITEDEAKFIDKIDIRKPNTAKLVGILEDLGCGFRNVLIVLDKNDQNIRKSVANIEGVETVLVENLNAYFLIKAHEVIFFKDAIEKIHERFKK